MRSHRFLLVLLPLALAVIGVQPPSSRAQGVDDGTWSTILPPTVRDGTYAFDSRRDRTFHFDAQSSAHDEVWLRPIDGSPWSRVRIEEPAFPRGAARLLYDAPADRILALVAVRNQPLEVWAIDAGDPRAWVRLESEGAPASVFDPAIAYDTRRARWLVFGVVDARSRSTRSRTSSGRSTSRGPRRGGRESIRRDHRYPNRGRGPTPRTTPRRTACSSSGARTPVRVAACTARPSTSGRSSSRKARAGRCCHAASRWRATLKPRPWSTMPIVVSSSSAPRAIRFVR